MGLSCVWKFILQKRTVPPSLYERSQVHFPWTHTNEYPTVNYPISLISRRPYYCRACPDNLREDRAFWKSILTKSINTYPMENLSIDRFLVCDTFLVYITIRHENFQRDKTGNVPARNVTQEPHLYLRVDQIRKNINSEPPRCPSRPPQFA